MSIHHLVPKLLLGNVQRLLKLQLQPLAAFYKVISRKAGALHVNCVPKLELANEIISTSEVPKGS